MCMHQPPAIIVFLFTRSYCTNAGRTFRNVKAAANKKPAAPTNTGTSSSGEPALETHLLGKTNGEVLVALLQRVNSGEVKAATDLLRSLQDAADPRRMMQNTTAIGRCSAVTTYSNATDQQKAAISAMSGVLQPHNNIPSFETSCTELKQKALLQTSVYHQHVHLQKCVGCMNPAKENADVDAECTDCNATPTKHRMCTTCAAMPTCLMCPL